MIYKKLSGGNFSLYDSTTNTYYNDEEMNISYGGGHHLYYYLKAKNISTGSDKYSDPTDTVDMSFSYIEWKNRITTNQKKMTFELYQNAPNPFNPSTKIYYTLSEENLVIIKIYNILGQEVKTLVNGFLSPGLHSVIWDGRDRAGQLVPSGVYLYRIETKSFTKTIKMIMIK